MADGSTWRQRNTRARYRLDRTGLYTDRFRFLAAVAQEVPACLAELAALLTPQREALLCEAAGGAFTGPEYQFNAGAPLPSVRTAIPADDCVWWVVRAPAEVRAQLGPAEGFRWETPPEVVQLNAAVAAWASKWNLARDGAGGWVLATVGWTLYQWATNADLLPRTHFQALTWGGYGPTPSRGMRERLRPFTAAGSYRARVKGGDPAARELLAVEADHHLVALARWQVAWDGPPAVARRWAEVERRATPPANNVVTAKLRALARRFDLPARPRKHPGRPPG